MNSKDFLESIITGDESSTDNFNNLMAEKMSDALEVRKVEIASNMMGEATAPENRAIERKHDAKANAVYRKAERGNPAAVRKYLTHTNKAAIAGRKADKQEYLAVMPAKKALGGAKLKKEEVEQVDENLAAWKGKVVDHHGALAHFEKSKLADDEGNVTKAYVKNKFVGSYVHKHKDGTVYDKSGHRVIDEDVEQVQEVADAGSVAANKDLALHKRNLQVMNMAPTERSRVMTALKTHLAGRRLNMNQSTALLGYLGKAGGLGDVNAAVRNKALKQQSAKKDEV